jgi:type I restriction enzyme S subunit
MHMLATKTAVEYLNKESCNSIPLILPPLKEQTKIAEILSTVDYKLETLATKKVHFQTLKKGLMQKLLTGEVRVKASA